MSALTPLEYAVYGVLCAAKRLTGPQGGRRLFRIQEALDNWDEPAVEAALRSLMERGWVRRMSPVLGMIHYELDRLVPEPEPPSVSRAMRTAGREIAAEHEPG